MTSSRLLPASSSAVNTPDLEAPSTRRPAVMRVPSELWTHIFSHAADDFDVARASEVNKEWHAAANVASLPLPKRRLLARLVELARWEAPSWQRHQSMSKTLGKHFAAVGEGQYFCDAHAILNGLGGDVPRFEAARQNLLQPVFFHAFSEVLRQKSALYRDLRATLSSLDEIRQQQPIATSRQLLSPRLQQNAVTSRMQAAEWSPATLWLVLDSVHRLGHAEVKPAMKAYVERQKSMEQLGEVMRRAMQSDEIQELATLSEEELKQKMNPQELKRYARLSKLLNESSREELDHSLLPGVPWQLTPEEEALKASSERALVFWAARSCNDHLVDEITAPRSEQLKTMLRVEDGTNWRAFEPSYHFFRYLGEQTDRDDALQFVTRHRLLQLLGQNPPLLAALDVDEADEFTRIDRLHTLVPPTLPQAARWLRESHAAGFHVLQHQLLMKNDDAAFWVFDWSPHQHSAPEEGIRSAVGFEMLRQNWLEHS